MGEGNELPARRQLVRCTPRAPSHDHFKSLRMEGLTTSDNSFASPTLWEHRRCCARRVMRHGNCRFTTYRHLFARAAPAPRAKRNEIQRIVDVRRPSTMVRVPLLRRAARLLSTFPFTMRAWPVARSILCERSERADNMNRLDKVR